MSAACPVCDRETCPSWLARRGVDCPVSCGYLLCNHVGPIAQNNYDDCARHAHDWRAEALALRAELAALKARPLTVASALALPEVQSGACVVETPATDERCAEQLRLRQSGRLSSREYDRGQWGDWFASSDLSTAPKPCRLVPLAESDLPPATRGEMP